MLKRCTAMLLTLGLLLACLSPALAVGMTKAERYAAAQAELGRYFEGDNTKTLDELCLDFEDLGAYKMSPSFSYYVRVLRDIEVEEYGQIALLLSWMRLDEDFAEQLLELGFGSVDELEYYAQGRQAEAEGDTEAAIAAYRQSVSMLDSLLRMARLESTSLESQYQKAVELLNTGTVESCQAAAGLFEGLAARDYRDSEKLLAQARKLSIPTASPTPSPTPKRTPAPTHTPRPTAVPTPRPTATPTPVPTTVPTPVLVRRPTPQPTKEPSDWYWTDVGSYMIRYYGNGQCAIVDYDGHAKIPTIPGKLLDYRVVAIDKSAFSESTDMVEITIPRHIQWIGSSAFDSCTALQKVTIEEGIAVLEYGLFSNCTALRLVTLPESIVEISRTAFYNCPNVTLRVRENSYGHWYAVKYSIPYEIY